MNANSSELTHLKQFIIAPCNDSSSRHNFYIVTEVIRGYRCQCAKPCASHSWLYKGTWKLVCSLQKQNQKIALNYCFLLMVLIASFYHIKIGYIDVRVYNLSIHILKKLQATVWIATFVWIHGTPWDVKFDITKLRASFKPMSVLCFYSITYTKSLRTTTDIWPWWIPLINETKHPPAGCVLMLTLVQHTVKENK